MACTTCASNLPMLDRQWCSVCKPSPMRWLAIAGMISAEVGALVALSAGMPLAALGIATVGALTYWRMRATENRRKRLMTKQLEQVPARLVAGGRPDDA